jgi:hypothetical protein
VIGMRLGPKTATAARDYSIPVEAAMFYKMIVSEKNAGHLPRFRACPVNWVLYFQFYVCYSAQDARRDAPKENQMISRQYVTQRLWKFRPDLTQGQIDRFIDDAVRLLGNLVHYKHNMNHEDDDVVTAALMIGQDKQ